MSCLHYCFVGGVTGLLFDFWLLLLLLLLFLFFVLFFVLLFFVLLFFVVVSFVCLFVFCSFLRVFADIVFLCFVSLHTSVSSMLEFIPC